MPVQLQIPDRLELKDMTADEIQSLTPEECLALLPNYTAEELSALRSAYFSEWMRLTDHLIDQGRGMTEEQIDTRQARLREAHRRQRLLNDFHWWKKSGATLEDIKAAFEEHRETAEAERRYDEEWKARDAADLAAGKEYAVWRKLMAEKKAKKL